MDIFFDISEVPLRFRVGYVLGYEACCRVGGFGGSGWLWSLLQQKLKKLPANAACDEPCVLSVLQRLIRL